MPRRRWPYDELRAAVSEQYARIATAVEAMPDSAFALPTRLGEWRVDALIAHLVGNLDYLVDGLARQSAAGLAPTGLSYRERPAEEQARIAALAQEKAVGQLPDELRERLRVAVDATSRSLDKEETDRVVVIEERGPILLSEYLVTRCTEGVVHGLDLAAAVRVTIDPEPRALRAVVRLLADRLVERAPGRSVEVRIPGPAGCAVQCVEGPRHTRGTPGSVVEVRDALVWVELATGRVRWVDAVSDGRVSASGERADLTSYLPVLA